MEVRTEVETVKKAVRAFSKRLEEAAAEARLKGWIARAAD